MWFLFALVTTLAWGFADLFYKKSNCEDEKYSHLKTSITVGVVMGIHAVITIIAGNVDYNFINIVKYLPVSAMYIISMTVGYFGLRYLELSVSSPVQNSSGAVTCILCLVFLKQKIEALSAVAILMISVGVILLGVFEKKREDEAADRDSKRYKIGFVAFFMPIIYCVIDSLGTFFDAYYLDDFSTTPLVGVTQDNLEDVANISYEFTFFIVAVILFVYVKLIKRETFDFSKRKPGIAAAVFETAGQMTYVYAMSGFAVAAAPMISAYSIVALVLSAVFLKERLTKKQYISVALVIAGIIILGIFDA